MTETELPALRVFHNSEIIFTSNGKWLHPLFELETFLKKNDFEGSQLRLEDKIIGRGAAFLIVRLKIASVHARLLSELGRDVFEQFKVKHTWENLVPAIDCKTEGLLQEILNPDEAYGILKIRAEAGTLRP